MQDQKTIKFIKYLGNLQPIDCLEYTKLSLQYNVKNPIEDLSYECEIGYIEMCRLITVSDALINNFREMQDQLPEQMFRQEYNLLDSNYPFVLFNIQTDDGIVKCIAESFSIGQTD